MGVKWTENDKNTLIELWKTESISIIARKLGKTDFAIKNKAVRLGLKPKVKQVEYISLISLINALGLSSKGHYYVKRYEALGLKVIKRKRKKNTLTYVVIDDFWEWAEENKKHLNFAKFEKYALGVEPDWVDYKRNLDIKNPMKLDHNKVWTKNDDNLLISKVKLHKYTYAQLASEFNRTQGAIKKRLATLGVPYRPVPLDNHVKWTEDEKKKLMKLYREGASPATIAKLINKSELTIPDKIKFLEEKGY